MSGWEISLGVYTGLMIGFSTQPFPDGYRHHIYIPFLFIEIDTYYD